MMRSAIIGALLTVFAVVAGDADPLPALFDVTGVASDDVLNVRREPDAGSQKIGELAHDLRNVEVIATDSSGRWGMVNVGEQSGWTSLRYLARQPGNPDYALGQILHCSGTEPFWTFWIQQGTGAEFTLFDDVHPLGSAGYVTTAQGRPDRFFVGTAEGATAILRREMCSDGMSDRAFGIGIDLLINTDGPALYSGCCLVSEH